MRIDGRIFSRRITDGSKYISWFYLQLLVSDFLEFAVVDLRCAEYGDFIDEEDFRRYSEAA